MKLEDLNIFARGGPELDEFSCAYGNVEEAIKLDGGYYHIRFSPKWGRSSARPEDWKLVIWRIGMGRLYDVITR